MPSTVADVFDAAGLISEGVAGWREPIRCGEAGVYVVALSEDCTSRTTLRTAPIARSAIRHLLRVRPELTLDAQRPTPSQLAARIAAFWFADETILYIGKATSLSSRVGSYYRTLLGAKRPHAGGWWLKVLDEDVLGQLRVHLARVTSPETAEDRMMAAFCERVSPAARRSLHDPTHPFPFANLEWRTGGRRLLKAHGVRGATGDLLRQPFQ